MSIQDDVLKLFREEIPGYLDENWKEVPLELDSDLFDAPVMIFTVLWIDMRKSSKSIYHV